MIRWYEQDEYASSIQKAVEVNKHLRHEFHACSVLIQNFITGVGEILKNTSSGYDQVEQVKSVRRLYEILHQLKKWSS